MNVETIISLAGMLISGFFIYHRFTVSYIDKKLDKEVYRDFKEDINKKLDDIKSELIYLREKIIK